MCARFALTSCQLNAEFFECSPKRRNAGGHGFLRKALCLTSADHGFSCLCFNFKLAWTCGRAVARSHSYVKGLTAFRRPLGGYRFLQRIFTGIRAARVTRKTQSRSTASSDIPVAILQQSGSRVPGSAFCAAGHLRPEPKCWLEPPPASRRFERSCAHISTKASRALLRTSQNIKGGWRPGKLTGESTFGSILMKDATLRRGPPH